MFKIIEDSAPELIKISDSIYQDILTYLIIAVFLARLVYLQTTLSPAEKYRSLLVDFIAGYALLFLVPKVVVHFASIPETLFNSYAQTPLFIDLEKAPDVIDKDIGLFSSTKEVGLNLLHWIWIIVFYTVYYIWVIVYSVSIALCSLFVFLGTFLGQRKFLSSYLSLLTVLLIFPVVWFVFDKIVLLLLPQDELARGIGVVLVYILKCYSMFKVYAALAASKPAQFVKNFGKDSYSGSKKLSSFVADSKIGRSSSALISSGAGLVSAKMENYVTYRGLIKSDSKGSGSFINSGSDKSSRELTPAEKYIATQASQKSSVQNFIEAKEIAQREKIVKLNAQNFSSGSIKRFSNPSKAYGFSQKREVPVQEVPAEVFESAHNLSGYSKAEQWNNLTYNPDGNFIYDKKGVSNKEYRVHEYRKQIQYFNENLKKKFEIEEKAQ